MINERLEALKAKTRDRITKQKAKGCKTAREMHASWLMNTYEVYVELKPDSLVKYAAV